MTTSLMCKHPKLKISNPNLQQHCFDQVIDYIHDWPTDVCLLKPQILNAGVEQHSKHLDTKLCVNKGETIVMHRHNCSMLFSIVPDLLITNGVLYLHISTYHEQFN